MEETEPRPVSSCVLSEYEDVIRSLRIHLDVMTEEHKNLKEELFLLISENQELSNKLDAEHKERIKESVDGDFSEGFKSEFIINLQGQLDLCKKEKENALELYKTSIKLIEVLEEEVASQQENLLEKSQSKNLGSGPVVGILEAKLKNTKEHLDYTLNEREKLEGENIKHQTEIAKLKFNLESSEKIIDQLKLKIDEWKNRCNKSEQDYALLSATYECVAQSRNDLEKKLDSHTLKIQELVLKNNESRSKVEEALDIVEKALAEKELSLWREQQLREEVKKLHLCLEHVIDEAGKKVGSEVEETRKKFESNIKEVVNELSEAKKELERKNSELKRMTFKYKKLEKVASEKLNKEKISLIKGSETEITMLENQLDSVYQELERFKIKYEGLEKEKKRVEDELSDLIEKHRNQMKEKEAREVVLEETVEELKFQIGQKIEDLNEASKRCEFFLNQVRELQGENRDLKKIAGKCCCEKLKGKLKKLNEFREAQKTELENLVESQMALNETWKKEMKDIAEKFEEKIRGVKKECREVKAKNRKLTAELNAAKKKIFSLKNV